MQREIATGIVRQAFEFWFGDTSIESPERPALRMLQAYVDSHPEPPPEQAEPEQIAEPVVVSEV
jgi:hypothetical protein